MGSNTLGIDQLVVVLVNLIQNHRIRISQITESLTESDITMD